MFLYPILSPGQYQVLTTRGRLTSRWRRVTPDFLAAYRWMAAAMFRHGINTHGHPPVWAWHSYKPPYRHKPDLRASYHLAPPGTRAIRLVIDLPDQLALLSDFDAWHAVLNNFYLSHSEAEDRRINRAETRG